MTTQRDLATAAEVSLKICDKCGWYDGYSHATRCDPAAGRAASCLINAVPDMAAGQLGYGDGHVVFDLSPDFSVLFECGPRAFTLRDVHRLGTLSVDEAAALVRALREWADDIARKRKSNAGR
jgi:hypothetical protein